MAVPAASESGGAAAEKGFLAKMKKTKRRMVGVDGTVKYSCLKTTRWFSTAHRLVLQRSLQAGWPRRAPGSFV